MKSSETKKPVYYLCKPTNYWPLGSGSNSDSSKELLHQTLAFMKKAPILGEIRRRSKTELLMVTDLGNELLSICPPEKMHRVSSERYLHITKAHFTNVIKNPDLNVRILWRNHILKKLLLFFSMRKNWPDAYPHRLVNTKCVRTYHS